MSEDNDYQYDYQSDQGEDDYAAGTSSPVKGAQAKVGGGPRALPAVAGGWQGAICSAGRRGDQLRPRAVRAIT